MNSQKLIESVVADQLRKDDAFPAFTVGDTLNVHVRIIEGDKERIQVYQGVLIADRSRGINRTITVRRIVANEGVERIFPLHSPRIAKIEIVRRGDARRSKLFYLRERVGKSRRLRDQRRGLQHVKADDARQAKPAVAEEPTPDAAVSEAVAQVPAAAAETRA